MVDLNEVLKRGRKDKDLPHCRRRRGLFRRASSSQNSSLASLGIGTAIALPDPDPCVRTAAWRGTETVASRGPRAASGTSGYCRVPGPDPPGPVRCQWRDSAGLPDRPRGRAGRSPSGGMKTSPGSASWGRRSTCRFPDRRGPGGRPEADRARGAGCAGCWRREIPGARTIVARESKEAIQSRRPRLAGRGAACGHARPGQGAVPDGPRATTRDEAAARASRVSGTPARRIGAYHVALPDLSGIEIEVQHLASLAARALPVTVATRGSVDEPRLALTVKAVDDRPSRRPLAARRRPRALRRCPWHRNAFEQNELILLEEGNAGALRRAGGRAGPHPVRPLGVPGPHSV